MWRVVLSWIVVNQSATYYLIAMNDFGIKFLSAVRTTVDGSQNNNSTILYVCFVIIECLWIRIFWFFGVDLCVHLFEVFFFSWIKQKKSNTFNQFIFRSRRTSVTVFLHMCTKQFFFIFHKSSELNTLFLLCNFLYTSALFFCSIAYRAMCVFALEIWVIFCCCFKFRLHSLADRDNHSIK